jgi:hypothetical protein
MIKGKIMNKGKIKIIKRNRTGIAVELPAPVSAKLAETELQGDRASAVNRWISERRENFLVEKADSRNNIQAWRKLHSGLEVKES